MGKVQLIDSPNFDASVGFSTVENWFCFVMIEGLDGSAERSMEL